MILDYLENRNQEVRDLIAQLLLLHSRGRIRIATSVFNVAELIDKEFEIHFIGWCLKERMSYDETITRLRSDGKMFKDVAAKNRNSIEKQVKNFLFENEIAILSLSGEVGQYEELYDLIYQRQLQSQDALIVATALASKVTYFASTDSTLASKIGELLFTYDFHNLDRRKAFRDSVLEAV